MNTGAHAVTPVRPSTLRGEDIPSQVLRLTDVPEQLYVRGNLEEVLSRPRVGIIGSRKLTSYGRQVTETLAKDLAGQGIVIVSGLALGVDSVAHKAALDAGGLTLAVLPSSVESIYPASHRNLGNTIAERGGALVSEYPAGTPIFNTNFIARNRLIAAFSDVLLVTEAALKSGSLHTARFALEQGKDVLAVPGNITSPTSEGTNNLVKAGAVVVTDANDVLRILKITPQAAKQAIVGDTKEEQRILDVISTGIYDAELIQIKTELPVDMFNQSLTMLEITGKIRPLGANRWSL